MANTDLTRARLRLIALEARLERRYTLAKALGVKPLPPTAQDAREFRAALAEARAVVNAQAMRREVARARSRFEARA